MTEQFSIRNSERELAAWLKSHWMKSEIEDSLIRSLIRHLADLGLFKSLGEDDWELCDVCPTAGSQELTNWVERKLMELCQEKRGFVLKYFLREAPEGMAPHPLELPQKGTQETLSKDLVNDKGRILAKNSSNLSNLQIVKKVGRQLSPFLELEEHFVDQVSGEHTTRQDSRKLFNFFLAQLKGKSTPREWEQLSRRRHK